MKFCSNCGDNVVQRIPEGDDRLRFVCESCNTIHYDNPRVIVGCLPEFEGKVLLCKRAIAPREGWWTLPAGYLENGEPRLQGAARETLDEARARVADQRLYRLFDVPNINQLYMFYRAVIVDGVYGVGPESTEVALFSEDEIPWREIAFPVVHHALKEYFADRNNNHFPVRVSSIHR